MATLEAGIAAKDDDDVGCNCGSRLEAAGLSPCDDLGSVTKPTPCSPVLARNNAALAVISRSVLSPRCLASSHTRIRNRFMMAALLIISAGARGWMLFAGMTVATWAAATFAPRSQSVGGGVGMTTEVTCLAAAAAAILRKRLPPAAASLFRIWVAGDEKGRDSLEVIRSRLRRRFLQPRVPVWGPSTSCMALLLFKPFRQDSGGLSGAVSV